MFQLVREIENDFDPGEIIAADRAESFNATQGPNAFAIERITPVAGVDCRRKKACLQ
jgi:hypothetical protein